jgi:hypothetical protein
MADFRAITAVTQAIIFTLQSNYDPDDFNNDLEFEVYVASDFAKPMKAGVSLFLYRVLPNGVHRPPAGRLAPDGQRYRNMLPLDLHFLLTVWGSDATLQHTIAGWMMRVLEDTPILPAGLLNAAAPDAFNGDETVEVGLADLRTEDLFHLWETIVQNDYQLSVPYVARSIRIESTQILQSGQPVQERMFDYAKAKN